MSKKITQIPTYETPTLAVIDNAKTVAAFCSAWALPHFRVAQDVAERFLSLWYRWGGGMYVDRLDKWADLAGVSPRRLLSANLMYEFAQIGAGRPFGCTSAIIDTPDEGIVHIRNMDWELKNMGKSTVVIDEYKYLSICCPGMLGALSGMVVGAFSITMNWAPPNGGAAWELGPLFLLQYILENARTYEEAVELAEDTPLSTPALFSIAGTVSACVVERSQEYSQIREMRPGQPLVTTNHYLTSGMREYNQGHDADVNACSRERYRDAKKEAKKKRIQDYHDVLSTETTLHQGTIQQMVFYPEQGNYSVIAFNNNEYLD